MMRTGGHGHGCGTDVDSTRTVPRRPQPQTTPWLVYSLLVHPPPVVGGGDVLSALRLFLSTRLFSVNLDLFFTNNGSFVVRHPNIYLPPTQLDYTAHHRSFLATQSRESRLVCFTYFSNMENPVLIQC